MNYTLHGIHTRTHTNVPRDLYNLDLLTYPKRFNPKPSSVYMWSKPVVYIWPLSCDVVCFFDYRHVFEIWDIHIWLFWLIQSTDSMLLVSINIIE